MTTYKHNKKWRKQNYDQKQQFRSENPDYWRKGRTFNKELQNKEVRKDINYGSKQQQQKHKEHNSRVSSGHPQDIASSNDEEQFGLHEQVEPIVALHNTHTKSVKKQQTMITHVCNQRTVKRIKLTCTRSGDKILNKMQKTTIRNTPNVIIHILSKNQIIASTRNDELRIGRQKRRLQHKPPTRTKTKQHHKHRKPLTQSTTPQNNKHKADLANVRAFDQEQH